MEAGGQEEHLDDVTQRHQKEERGDGVGGGRRHPQTEREKDDQPPATPKVHQVHQEPPGFEGGRFRNGVRVATRFEFMKQTQA